MMNKLPRELAIDLKNYVLANNITGMTCWEIMNQALPNDTDTHEFLIQCIFNQLDLDGRPSTFEIEDESYRIIVSSAAFAAVIDYSINESEDFDIYVYRNGRIYDTYDEEYV
jgi:hypothetical protein